MSTSMAGPVLLVANPGPEHVGRHLLDAARQLGVPVELADVRRAFDGPAWWRRVNWRLRGHRPPRLTPFSAEVVRRARAFGADTLLTTGIAPVDGDALTELGALGVTRMNFLTDDPWNPAHYAAWFIDALDRYDVVFSPRDAVLSELRALGGPRAVPLAFGYNPDVHVPAPPRENSAYEADVMFAGGADADRIRTVLPFIDAGLRVALYGGYWDRDRRTAPHARGMLPPGDLAAAVAGARVCLCLVRRANRDGHSMRTFELAAMAGCMLVEHTADHERVFGVDDDAVVYFTSPSEGVVRTRELLEDPDRRARLRRRVVDVIRRGRHSYADRLETMLSHVPEPAA